MTTANDYTQHRLDFVSHMHDAVEALGYVYEAMPGSPWSEKITDMLIELRNMIDTTDEDLNALGVANCMNCNGRTAPANLHKIGKLNARFCTACRDHFNAGVQRVERAAAVRG